MTRKGLFIAATLLALGAGAIWLLFNLEQVPERVWVGYQGEARRNPWLAAERLLTRMGRKIGRAKTVPDLRALPRDGTLFLPRRLAALTRDEQLKLLGWVDGGGHLIVEAELTRQDDPLLDALGIGRASIKRGKAARAVLANLPGSPRPLKVEIGEWRTLHPKEARLALKGMEATFLVHLEHGAGRVTALTDLSFANNSSIGNHDHAEFLWQVVQLRPQAGTVAFFHSPQKLSLAQWLRENAWAVLAAGALLLAAWLWHVAPRFGPVAPDAEPARKRLLDHLRASGRFQWSSGGAGALAEAAREAALRRIIRAQPDFAALGPAERAERLSVHFGLSPQAARWVLHPARGARPAELVAAAGVFQSIHEQLTINKGRR